MHSWLIYDILLGLGVSQSFLIHFWLPDPPPDLMAIMVRLLAGGIGGGFGGWIASGLEPSNPMPGAIVVGAIAGATLLVGLAGAFAGGSAARR